MKNTLEFDNCKNALYELDWLERQAMLFLSKIADDDGFVYHPSGKSVSALIAWALDCHETSAYKIVRVLGIHGLIQRKAHPKHLRQKSCRGFCIRLLYPVATLRDLECIEIMKTWPPGEKWAKATTMVLV